MYKLLQKSPDSCVQSRQLKKQYPALMSTVTAQTHGQMLYALTRPLQTMPAFVTLVDRKGTYQLTDAGVAKAQQLLGDSC